MSDDRGMDVSPSWQELKDERDALRRTVSRQDALIRELDRKLHDGRDKYNAMVEQCQEFHIQTGVLCSRLIETKGERDALAAWRENVIAKWESMSLRPHAGEMMDLGNAMLDSPEYTHRRHAEHVEALREDRDALAAHVERLHEEIDYYAGVKDVTPEEAMDALVRLKQQSHKTTPLARMVAENQEEVVELIRSAMRVHGFTEAEGLVNTLAQALRRQAEGGEA